MANFLLQKDDDVLNLETTIVEELLKKDKYVHRYSSCSLKEMKDFKYAGCIPIGTIEFVTTYLRNTFDKNFIEVPIEIPKYLQTNEFLKRDYKIVSYDEIPSKGSFFLKDVSQLKVFGSVLNTDYEDINQLFNQSGDDLKLDKTHLYQISDILPIKSEYRVYVIDNKIHAISNYDGDPCLFPDIDLIKKAILMIEYNEKHLKSYTIDIAVGNFGTALLEIHNFTSVGLYYGLWGKDLLYAYIDGINYLKDDNTIKYI